MRGEISGYKKDTVETSENLNLKKIGEEKSLQDIVNKIDGRIDDQLQGFSKDSAGQERLGGVSDVKKEIVLDNELILKSQKALETVRQLGAEAGIDVADATADIEAEIKEIRKRSGGIETLETDEGIDPEFNEFKDKQSKEKGSSEKQTESPLIGKALEIKDLNDKKLKYQGDIENLKGVIDDTQSRVIEAREKLGIDSTEPPLSVKMEIEKMEKTKVELAEAEKKQGELMKLFLKREYGIEKSPTVGAKEQLADEPEDKNDKLKGEIEDSIDRASQAGEPLEKDQEEALRQEAIGGLSQKVKSTAEGKRSIGKDAEVAKNKAEEENKIYDNPEDDPSIQEVEKNILRITNEEVQYNQKGGWGKMAAEEANGVGYGRSWTREKFLASTRQWDNFLSAHPKKAEAYKKTYLPIKEAFEERERLRVSREQKEQLREKKRREEEKREKTIEDDPKFQSFMNNPQTGLNARVWEGVSREKSLTGEQYDEKAKIIREQMKQEFSKMHPDLAEKYGIIDDVKSESVDGSKKTEKRGNLTDRIGKVQSFDELKSVLGEIGEIRSTYDGETIFSAEDFKLRIDDLRKNMQDVSKYLDNPGFLEYAGAHGFKDKIIELLKKETVASESRSESFDDAENEPADYFKEWKGSLKEEQSEEKGAEVVFYEKLKERYSKSVSLPQNLSPEKRYAELFGKKEFSEEDENLLKKMGGEKLKELDKLRGKFFLKNIPKKDIVTMRNYYNHKKTDPDSPLIKLAGASAYWENNG